MQKFVDIVLKKLLNEYSVTPLYYGYTLYVLFQNKCNINLITTFDNSLILCITLVVRTTWTEVNGNILKFLQKCNSVKITNVPYTMRCDL